MSTISLEGLLNKRPGHDIYLVQGATQEKGARLIRLGKIEEVQPVFMQLTLLMMAPVLHALQAKTLTVEGVWRGDQLFGMQANINPQQLLDAVAGGGVDPLSQQVACNLHMGRTPAGLSSASGMKNAMDAWHDVACMLIGYGISAKELNGNAMRSFAVRCEAGLKMMTLRGQEPHQPARLLKLLALLQQSASICCVEKLESL